MPLFTSKKEKRLWLYVVFVLFAIGSILAVGRPLQDLLRDQNVQAVFFMVGLLLVGATIFAHGMKVRPAKTEWVIWLGLISVYTMFVFRLGAPERSHLIEYSVLAIFIHKALMERMRETEQVFRPAAYALVSTIIIGALDESIQLYLPDRVYDPEDIVFNSLAAFMAIGLSLMIQWARRKFRKA